MTSVSGGVSPLPSKPLSPPHNPHATAESANTDMARANIFDRFIVRFPL
jgi:hypothetical protein